MYFLDTSKTTQLQPAAGRLLIATPFLKDPNFARSVILLCAYGTEGTVGFILNRPTTLHLGDLLPELYTEALPVFQGGPVETDTLHILHRAPEILGGTEVLPGTFWGGSYDALQQIVQENTCPPADLRLLVGYSGWSPGQLERELEEGSWLVSGDTGNLPFDTGSEDMWRRSMQHLGKEFTFMTNLPTDPQLN